jgi:hypothetical protein
MPLERIALHQTRLRTPGLGLDGKGVALGGKGLVLLPSIDRLVAWLSVYTREHSLEDIMPSLEIKLVRSKLGTREITLAVAAESSDRMDRIAETARLVGGFTFTGTSRHFVQYRDASAPFGYDAQELLSTDAALVVYNDKFTQAYESDKDIDLRALLLRLMPHVDPSTIGEGGPRYIVAEQGLGPALIHYLVRSRVDGEVAVGEWPPESAFDEGPLMATTPGITSFLPVGPGVAVEMGYRHPVALRACPVFDPNGLVLIRGKGLEPWALTRAPQMGDLRAFARVELRSLDDRDASTATSTLKPDMVRVPLRVVPSMGAFRNVTASWLLPHEIPLLRKLAYALPRKTIETTQISVTKQGAFLRCPSGIEAIPLGTFYVEIHPGLYIPAGYDFIPAVAPEVLHRALGAVSGTVLFIDSLARAVSVDDNTFSPLENMLLERIDLALEERPLDLKLEGLGTFPMGGAELPPPAAPQLPQGLPHAPELPPKQDG